MRKALLLAFVFLASFTAFAQDFSNKGKDFWVGYGYHTQMIAGNGNSQDMVLYFATDQVTNIVIKIPATGYTQNITTAAGNNVITSAVIPKAGVQDARLLNGGLSNNGIHITSDKPMVAYAHVYNGSCSGATILYPTNTLGREYYSVNYKNWSNQNNANCWFYVVAVDTGTTTIEITPQADQAGVVTTAASGSWTAGTTYTVNLTQGQIYNVMGILTTSANPFKGVDLTGSKIKSINNGTGCKKIAVFSGSGRISITCNANSSSSDNYMVQAMPKNAWGKKFLTVQANGNQANNIYRVCVSSPAAVVKINGAVTALPLQNNFYYEIPATNQPQLIEADSAIMVAQYFTSQGACGNGNQPGDPEVIYLSPVEQNINKVIWYATPNFAITSHSLNVVIPNTGTALSSFRLNGAAVGGWVTHPQDAGYSYLRTNVGAGFNVIQSDSGFNAIAYGFGNAESYGYNAGTNIKDLYQQIGVQTTYGIETSPSVCTNSPFKFKVSLPYIPDSMHWDFHNAAGMLPNNNTVYVDNTGNIAEDSSTVVNGKTIHWYSIPLTYTFTTVGTYPVTITTFVPNGECGSVQDIDFDLGVSDPPIAGFTAPAPGCYLEPVVATETTPQFPKTTYKLWWEFYDPVTNLTTVFTGGNTVRSVSHTFTTPGVKRIRYSSITTPGCLSDTLVQFVTLPDIPDATVTGNVTACINTGTVPVTFTGTGGTAEYIFSYNINGGATQTTPPSTGGSYTINAPTNVAGPFVYNLIGVANALPVGTPCTRTISGQSITVNITPDATVTLRPGDNDNQSVCINTPIINIRYDVGGSGTGGSVSGLPAGVTGTYAAGVITITGTPTVAGTFNYVVSTTGPCLTPQANGVITVNPDHTISLTGGTASQTVCINTPISPITLTLGGGATGINPAGLPPGVTASVAGNIVTISGTPTSTAGSPYNYTLTTTGNSCVTASFTGAITVNPDHAIALAGGNPNQTVCVNVAITPFTLTLSGGATNIAAPVNLPPGVTANVVGNTVTISGTPTLAGSYPYSITTSGNSCLTANFTGTINVSPDHTISLTGGNGSQTVCINTPISPITLTLGGGATGINPAGLPPGVTATVIGNTVTISGSPTSTAGSPYNYTLTTTGNSCVTANFTGAITVNPDHAIALGAGNPNQTVCVNVAITPFTLTLSGGANNIAAPVNLPPGVTANVVGNTVTISGTPTSAGSYPYTITTAGNTCLTANFTGTINVTADATIALTSAAGTDNQTVCRNTAIADIDYTTGGSATGANITWVPSAPAGITFTPVGANGYKISGTPTVVGTQTYVYTISTTGPCVKPTATGSITVNALPVASFTVPPPSCANNTIVFTNTSTPNAGPVTSWSWDFGDPNANAGNPNTSTAQSPTHYYILPGTYTATLNVVNSNGCISAPDASVTFIVNDTPRAGFIVPDVCINDVATVFTDTSKINPGNSITGWYWDFGDPPSGPLNTSTAQHGSHLYPAPGNYTVMHVAISNNGCRDTMYHVITINSADPVANFTAGNKCSSDSVELVNLSTVGFGNVTRLEIYWDNVGAPGVFQTINAPAFNGIYRHKYPTSTTTQNYVIRMVAYSGVICSAQKITPVTVYATPRVQFNNIPNTCYLVAPFQLTQGSEIGGVPGTGTYSGPGITNPNGTFNPQVAGIGTHQIKYTWTASNPGACIDTLTRTITVLDTAHAVFGVTLPSCEQTPTSFTNLSTAPASVTLASTVWDFGDATGSQLFPVAAPITHTYANPGTYTVTMHNISAAGCLSTDTTAQVTIDANHHITWDAASGSQNQALCVNTALVPIKYTLTGGATNINFVPALPPGLSYTVGGTPLTVTISGAPTVPANYSFGIQTTGNTCLIASANITISVAPDHAIALRAGSDSAQSVCVNTAIDPIEYDLGGGATGAVVTNLPPGVTYSVTGNILTISGTPTSSAGGPLFNFAIQTTGNACLKANTIGEIAVNDYPVPAFAFDKTSYCIPNANVGFINNTTPAPLSNHTYVWDFGDGGTSTAASPTHLYNSEGPFTVTLKARSTVLLNHGVIGCESSKGNQLTTIHPQPKADFVFSKPSVCIGDNVLITDATDGKDGIVNKWHWELGDGTIEVTNPITHTYADTNTYVITMYAVNSFGCNSDTINRLPLVGAPYKPFSVYPYPHVNAGLDKNVLEGGSVQLDATAYAREPQYTWSPADYLTDSKILNPRVMNPKTDMTYRLTVTGKGGCQLSDDVFVKLLRFPVIPNTFSPNGDGINDTWRIDYLNTYPDNRVQIFTRAGKLVFESRGYNTPWDGTLKGKPLPFDTYYYIIEPGNGRDPITGYITILK